MAINLSYIIFAACAALVFWRLPVRVAIALVFFGGWLLLPVGNYPPLTSDQVFPYWITGLAVPSDMLITKAWVAPATAFVMAIIYNASALRAWRPSVLDLPMALWCVWPLISGTLTAAPQPDPLIASLYMTGSWGLSWLLGRIWFSGPDGALVLMKAVSFAGLACLPIALVESFNPPALYEFFYNPHPFRFDGAARYVGYRPIGFFEHGSQYGIWVAISALNSSWLAVALRHRSDGKLFFLTAIITFFLALASQSIGAIVLFLAGLILMVLWGRRFVLPLLAASIFMAGLAGVVHISGILPLETIARDTEIGRMTLSFFRELGRGSFLWRLSQDFKTLNLIHATWAFGAGDWDWWRPANTRPWGLVILMIGQYGLTGIILAFGSLFTVVGVNLKRLRNAGAWKLTSISLPLAFAILLALVDMLLNSFIYFPAIFIAGALVAKPASENNLKQPPFR